VVGFPLTLVIRNNPESYGLLPDGEPPSAEASQRKAASKEGFEVKEALRIPAFYLLVVTQAVFGFAHSPWNTLQVPHLEAAGFSATSAGLLIAVYGLGQIPIRLTAGMVGDRLGRKRVYQVGYACHGLGLMAFAFLSPERLWLVPVYYLVFGMAQGAQHTAGQSVMADYFGPKRYATIRGLGQSLVLPATILSPIFAGAMFDRHGNYQLAYVILGCISATGVLWLSLIRRPQWSEVAKAKAGLGVPGEAPAR
jgi:MFS family permease